LQDIATSAHSHPATCHIIASHRYAKHPGEPRGFPDPAYRH